MTALDCNATEAAGASIAGTPAPETRDQSVPVVVCHVSVRGAVPFPVEDPPKSNTLPSGRGTSWCPAWVPSGELSSSSHCSPTLNPDVRRNPHAAPDTRGSPSPHGTKPVTVDLFAPTNSQRLPSSPEETSPILVNQQLAKVRWWLHCKARTATVATYQ